MSWWGNWDKGISKMASTALKQAQKKIDKVLDIQEGEGQPSEAVSNASNDNSPTLSAYGNDSFFQEWLGDNPQSLSKSARSSSPRSITDVNITEYSKNDQKALGRRTSGSSSRDLRSPSSEINSVIASPNLDTSFTHEQLRKNPTANSNEERSLSFKMSESQITNVGDWTMSESTMLMSQFDDILVENLTGENERIKHDESYSGYDHEAAISVKSDLANSDVKPSMTNQVTSEDNKDDDKQETVGKEEGYDKVEKDDEVSMIASIGDRASHLSLSSDCTDLTLRGDDGTTGSRGISPSDQLTMSKDSNDSVYSSKSLHSEPLLESSELTGDYYEKEIEILHEDVKTDILSENSFLEDAQILAPCVTDDLNNPKKDVLLEHGENNVEAQSEAPLELSAADQPVAVRLLNRRKLRIKLPSISPSPVHPESSPTALVLDESETGTSSDIEVISSSCTSNNGGDLHMPGTGLDSHHFRLSSHTRSVSDCSFLSNIMESVPSEENLSQSALSKKLSEIKEVLEIRENKLLQMSKENIDLRETNNILRQQLHQSESARQEEMTDINALTVEFTNRIGEAEKRLQSAAREKEQLKKKIQKLEAEVGNKSEERRNERQLAEKQEQIDELLREGEKMAQEQLKTNNIVKKLRAKEREADTALQAQTARADKLETDNEHLRKVLDNRDENEKQHVDAINQLTRAVQKQDKEIVQYKRQIEEFQEKCRSLQVNLEAAFKELSELHKSNAMAASEAANATLSAEVAAREHTKAAMAQMESEWGDERRLLRSELEELRFSLSNSERESARREEQLRAEIEYLHGRLSASEQRNEELTSGLGTATRPVLRQLEALQASFSAQSSSWEQAERQLNERLLESQKSLSTALEQERDWRERVAELEGRLSAQESQVTNLRQEKGRQAAALQTEKSKTELLEEEKHRLLSQLNSGQSDWKVEKEELRKELVLMENNLELSRSQLDVEKRRSLHLSDRLIAAERRAAVASEQQKERRLSTSSQNSAESTPRSYRSPNNTSLYSILRDNNASGGAALLEHLQASVQQKDGDIAQLHRDVQHLDKTREALILDMMEANQKSEELQDKLAELQQKQVDYDGLNQRYNALLQMFGEKMEENEELRLDLIDVKEMYKAQIDLLTQGK